MRDFVLVKEGQEEAFVEKALQLGYDQLVLVYAKAPKKPYSSKKINISTLIEDYPSPGGYLVLGTSISQIPKKATHLLFNEFDQEKDFVHQRRSGLNHVHMKACAEKNCTILFGFTQLQGTTSEYQSQILGRMKQNALLAKKYGVRFELVSYATSPQEMRRVSDVEALQRVYFN